MLLNGPYSALEESARPGVSEHESMQLYHNFFLKRCCFTDMHGKNVLRGPKLFYVPETTVIKYSNVILVFEKIISIPCCFAQAKSESSQLVVLNCDE